MLSIVVVRKWEPFFCGLMHAIRTILGINAALYYITRVEQIPLVRFFLATPHHISSSGK